MYEISFYWCGNKEGHDGAGHTAGRTLCVGSIRYLKSSIESFLPRNRPSRQHDYQLVPRTPKDGVRGPQSNSFFYRATKTWNELPKIVTHANNISAFKIELDNAWKGHPLRYNIQSDS